MLKHSFLTSLLPIELKFHVKILYDKLANISQNILVT